MIFFRALLLCIIAAGSIYAQNLDSLYGEFLRINGLQSGLKIPAVTHAHEPGDKCAFGLTAQIHQNFDSFAPQQQQTLSVLLQRPSLHKSIVSPSGFFRIHYDTTGSRAPAYSVQELALAYDSVYNYEVNYLGYNPPPPDNSQGGDDRYDIYIMDLGPGNYGITYFVSGQKPSYAMIDNDFLSTYTTGFDAAKVTAAHEFHHAIQIANYVWIDSYRYFYELTSTAMEEFVFTEVNDYYGYIPTYFRQPQKTLSSFSGYELGIFYLYLQQRLQKEMNAPMTGHSIIKRAWELLAVKSNPLQSMSTAMFEHGTSLEFEFNTFGLWNYFTKEKANPARYFDEGEFYPKIKPFGNYNFEPPLKEYMLRAEQMSNNYLVFNLGSLDTLTSIITNFNIGASSASAGAIDYEYALSKGSNSGSRNIVNDYYSTIKGASKEYLIESNIFNNEIVSGGEFNQKTLDYAFPQPFRYGKANNVYVPVYPNNLGYADLNIYTISMDLVYSGREQIINGKKIVVKWDARTSSGGRLPSGVYIYVTKSDKKITKGKLLILNE